MELQQLRYVMMLAQELHFHRSAQRLNVTQPTLSQQVKKLEGELGVVLFERSSRGVRLTQAGRRFLPHARSILDQVGQAKEAIEEEQDTVVGNVRLGVIPTICSYLMPEVVRRLRHQAPKLKLELYEETTSILLEHLKAGQLDAGLLALPIQDRGLASMAIGEEEFFLAVARNHPMAGKRWAKVEDLGKEQLLVLQEGHCFRSQALEYCKGSVQDSQIIFQGSSLTSVMKLAASGEGVTLVPKMAVEPSWRSRLQFIPFKSPKPTREIGVVWRLTAPLNRAHNQLISVIESVGL